MPRAHRVDDARTLVTHFDLDQVSRERPHPEDPALITRVATMLARSYEGMLLTQAEPTDNATA
jgi:hypothetical protein